jgi:hypothetical protein
MVGASRASGILRFQRILGLVALVISIGVLELIERHRQGFATLGFRLSDGSFGPAVRPARLHNSK